MDRVKPLKIESPPDGTQLDLFPTEVDDQEDYISVKGIAFGSDIDFIDVDPSTGQIRISDSVYGTRTLPDSFGGYTESEHAGVDQLVHNVSENAYMEVTRSGGLITSEVYWTDSGKTQKIREYIYTRSGNLISQIVIKQYDSSGILAETETRNYNRSGGFITSISITKS